MLALLVSDQPVQRCSCDDAAIQRSAVDTDVSRAVADRHGGLEVLPDSGGESLDAATRAELEPRFGTDFSDVRVHTGPAAAASARAFGALAYTVGTDIVFAAGQHRPSTPDGRRLIAHELTHVVQQARSPGSIVTATDGVAPADGLHEREAEALAEAVTAGGPAGSPSPVAPTMQLRPAPYIKQVTVHLTPPQTAELAWEGTPPSDAPGSDSFTVSTGKGYGDPDDPPGTCTRNCCGDAMTQCAPPWNQPDRVGSCCTYYGSGFWTGTPQTEHNGWQWWTPVQPWYGVRGIALHQHTEVTGQPIGHGCVRMDEPNAKRIFDYSNGRRTAVSMDGRAAPVACDTSRTCGGAGSTHSGQEGALEIPSDGGALASVEPVPGLEGERT